MTFSNNWYNAEQLKQIFYIENKKYKKYNKLIINKLCFLYFLSSFFTVQACRCRFKRRILYTYPQIHL